MGDPSELVIKHASNSKLHEGIDKGINEAQHVGDKFEVPAYEEPLSYDSLKQRIRHHYELASDYYYSLWCVLKLYRRTQAFPSSLSLVLRGHKRLSRASLYLHRPDSILGVNTFTMVTSLTQATPKT